MIKSYKIEKESYKLSNITLYTATNTDINEKVLIHIFPKENLKSNANEVTFMNNQVYLMKILNHKNILQLYEIIETKTHAFLIYEYFNGIKLSDYISKKKKLPEDEALKIYKEILSALLYLKEMYICNLNINSHNILIDIKNYSIKICNFKFGHFYSPKEKSKSNLIGDYFSACPELHSKRPYNPECADIWSSGILLYQMVSGNLPFKSQKDLELIRLIIRGDYTMPSSLSTPMKNLIKGLLETKEEKRFKLNDIFNQQIIKDKKITKASLTPGLNILTTKYPIDDIVKNIFKSNLNIKEDTLSKDLENNKFNEITSLFKQIIAKLKLKNIPTINDLYSNKFISYIKDNKNLLKEDIQINNIQTYLKKEEETKKKSEDIAAILLNNQNEISKGLLDLKKQYERAKKGYKPIRRTKSFGNNKNKKKRMYEFEEKNNEKKQLVDKLKRNTAVFQDVANFGLNKEDSKKIEKKIKSNEANKKVEEKSTKKEEVKAESKKENEINNKNSNSNSKNAKTEKENKIKGKEEHQTLNKQIPKKIEKLPQKIETKKEEKKLIPDKKISNNINSVNNIAKSNNNKLSMKEQIQLKAKKLGMVKPPNESKKVEKNNMKPKPEIKKEEPEIDKDIVILKSFRDLKIMTNKPDEVKPPLPKKAENKTGGFKNIKDMIEQNLRRQSGKK